MCKKINFLILAFLSLTLWGQNGSELNVQSQKLIEQQKYKEAFPILMQAAELGNVESQYNLGYFYQAGIGVERNPEKAIEWYKKSADQGFNDGIYQLMMMYGTGNGVQQDFSKALSYALQCAQNGDGTCMYNVVNCYKDGIGTKRDINKMMLWAIRLGTLENPDNLKKSGYITSARLNLAYLYRDGTVIKQDDFRSYQWFLIFNESKRDFSYIQQEEIVKEIQEQEEKLTAEQKINAQKEAEKILGRPLKNIANLHKAES